MKKTKAEERAEGWFRPLADGRLEIFLKAKGVKLRCSGDESAMHELVDWFEEKTGLDINAPDSGVWTRKRRGTKPIRGQLNLIDNTDAPVFEDDEGVGLTDTKHLGVN
jgi:hypothetical protein